MCVCNRCSIRVRRLHASLDRQMLVQWRFWNVYVQSLLYDDNNCDCGLWRHFTTKCFRVINWNPNHVCWRNFIYICVWCTSINFAVVRFERGILLRKDAFSQQIKGKLRFEWRINLKHSQCSALWCIKIRCLPKWLISNFTGLCRDGSKNGRFQINF